MEQFIVFNGVKILLTTGQCLEEVQNFLDEDPDVIVSANPGDVRMIVRRGVKGTMLNPR